MPAGEPRPAEGGVLAAVPQRPAEAPGVGDRRPWDGDVRTAQLADVVAVEDLATVVEVEAGVVEELVGGGPPPRTAADAASAYSDGTGVGAPPAATAWPSAPPSGIPNVVSGPSAVRARSSNDHPVRRRRRRSSTDQLALLYEKRPGGWTSGISPPDDESLEVLVDLREQVLAAGGVRHQRPGRVGPQTLGLLRAGDVEVERTLPRGVDDDERRERLGDRAGVERSRRATGGEPSAMPMVPTQATSRSSPRSSPTCAPGH